MLVAVAAVELGLVLGEGGAGERFAAAAALDTPLMEGGPMGGHHHLGRVDREATGGAARGLPGCRPLGHGRAGGHPGRGLHTQLNCRGCKTFSRCLLYRTLDDQYSGWT